MKRVARFELEGLCARYLAQDAPDLDRIDGDALSRPSLILLNAGTLAAIEADERARSTVPLEDFEHGGTRMDPGGERGEEAHR